MADEFDPRKAEEDIRPNGYISDGFGPLGEYTPADDYKQQNKIGDNEAKLLLLSRLGGIAGFVQSTRLFLAHIAGETPEGFLWVLGGLTVLSAMVFVRNGVLSALVLAGYLALGVAQNFAAAIEGDIEIAWSFMALNAVFFMAFTAAAWAGWRLYKDHDYPNPFEEWD
ncbi:MAG: hypothetical protein HRT80_14885 [Henriciella sp.]|nr:hypothetical protein [Henriciella sp.]